ncbi:MAG TPA: glycosyltransferase 87 family protein [Rubrobacteraceae bacterium]|nr:glycosyltransferase 87 family protein [Rubrobacteraceae bacterium]
MYALLFLRFAGLPPDLKDNSNDLRIYRDTGEAVLRGEFPYRDFFIEYPPGSVPAFVPPAFFSDSTSGYITLFANEMALLLVAALALVALAARKMWTGYSWSVPALTFAASAVLLYPVAVTRYDAVVALTLAVATWCAVRGGRWPVILGYASLGFGAAAKLVPALAALPLALIRRRSAVPGFFVFFAVVALFFGPAVLLAGGQFADSFAYHAQRGLQVESVGSSVLMQLGWIREIVFEFGAFEARGRGTEFASSISLPVTAALLGLTALVMYRKHREGGTDAGLFARHAAALILAFMLGSKVLSPQYMIWLLPLLPLAAPRLTGLGVSALFLAACWTTTQVFPVHYNDLLTLRSPGPQLLLARNLLLAFLWVLMLLLPTSAPTGERSDKAAS